jgi:hypothetical protein
MQNCLYIYVYSLVRDIILVHKTCTIYLYLIIKELTFPWFGPAFVQPKCVFVRLFVPLALVLYVQRPDPGRTRNSTDLKQEDSDL